MSNQKLWIIANATNQQASFSSTNGDSGNCPAYSVTHTGGTDGNYIQIPDCSGSQWYNDHRILVQAQSWTVAFWANDQENGMLYWSPSNSYYGGNPLEGSDSTENLSLLITFVNNQLQVYWSPF
ncbi:hypothetical protein INH39_11930 [Massilia violaceinigra]|uniref:Bulb-type lectin domain-containing protein n=1 Tax=Massilia violaceinigra TaxID=2045208 RepID=A0ABY4AC91_9BURK|nr:hypothetical protein [Massilia violaceinigra]UOD32308.1 hypothetical protein INH39_11930 [Massilia violaceinigra]